MVRVGSRDDSHSGRQLVERAVKLIGLYHNQIAFRLQQNIGSVVARDASQESVAAYLGLVKQVRQERRSSGLAVRS